MILLMGTEDDPQIIAVADALTQQGHSFLIFDSGLYPTQHRLSYRPMDSSMHCKSVSIASPKAIFNLSIGAH